MVEETGLNAGCIFPSISSSWSKYPFSTFFSPNYCKNLVTRFLVDEAAMVYMAYQCVGNQAYQDKQTAAIDYILKQQDDKGVFGNEYSTALALQVGIICRVFCFTI